MITPLLTVRFRQQRDVVAARQRARQIARLLGFSPADQARIAARVFEAACMSLQTASRGALRFQMRDGVLEVIALRVHREGGRAGPDSRNRRAGYDPDGVRRLLRRMGVGSGCSGCTPPCVERPVPPGAPALAADDLPWLAQHLARLTPVDLFEEIRRQNQDVLYLTQEPPTARVQSAA
jgi:hypothetical protein